MSGGFFWLAATTGLLSLLTPCVFPMVPVTIAFFARPGDNRSAGLRRPLLFGLGIVATFTVLGLALAAQADVGKTTVRPIISQDAPPESAGIASPGHANSPAR